MEGNENKRIARMRVVFGWWGDKVEFQSEIFGWVAWTPYWLQDMPEGEMQKHVEMELCNPPLNRAGEWKPVFDQKKNVVPKYFPPPEIAELLDRAQRGDDDVYYFY